MAVKVCPQCGNEVDEKALTCPFCGYSFEGEDTQKVKLQSSREFEDLIPIMEKIGDKYEVIRFIGKGGFSKVFLVRDKILDRKCALKVLSPEVMNDSEMLERFKREAKIYATLEHPNIVPIYEVGIYNNIAYIVMKFIEGKTLKAIIKERNKLRFEDIAEISLDILSAIQYMHNKGVIHRDIKPANIIIEKSTGKAILADFGLAKKTGDSGNLTRSGEMLGTPYYVSPEQAKGENLSSASDIYSFGITLFEMATGKVPFIGDTPLQILWKHVRDPLPSPTKYNPRIPLFLERIILKATDKRPKNRYKSALNMAKDLKKLKFYVKGMRVYRSKRRIISIGKAALLIVVLLLLGGGYYFRSDIKRIALQNYLRAKNILIKKSKEEPEGGKGHINGVAKTESSLFGKVIISSNFSSKIYVDGKYIGIVPPEKKFTVNKGNHIVKFVSEKYGVVKESFSIEPGKTKKLFHIFPIFAFINSIDSTPHGEVYIDGKFVGITKLENIKLPAGKHIIEIKREGYRTIRKEIELKGGESLEVISFQLKKIKEE